MTDNRPVTAAPVIDAYMRKLTEANHKNVLLEVIIAEQDEEIRVLRKRLEDCD